MLDKSSGQTHDGRQAASPASGIRRIFSMGSTKPSQSRIGATYELSITRRRATRSVQPTLTYIRYEAVARTVVEDTHNAKQEYLLDVS